MSCHLRVHQRFNELSALFLPCLHERTLYLITRLQQRYSVHGDWYYVCYLISVRGLFTLTLFNANPYDSHQRRLWHPATVNV